MLRADLDSLQEDWVSSRTVPVVDSLAKVSLLRDSTDCSRKTRDNTEATDRCHLGPGCMSLQPYMCNDLISDQKP